MSEIQGFQAVEVYREIMGWDIADLSKERPWTRDQEEYLIELYRLGWTFEQMAVEMNRRIGYIAGRIFQLDWDGVISGADWGVKAKDKSKLPKGPVEVWV